jgi:hypothetical protein
MGVSWIIIFGFSSAIKISSLVDALSKVDALSNRFVLLRKERYAVPFSIAAALP